MSSIGRRWGLTGSLWADPISFSHDSSFALAGDAAPGHTNAAFDPTHRVPPLLTSASPDVLATPSAPQDPEIRFWDAGAGVGDDGFHFISPALLNEEPVARPTSSVAPAAGAVAIPPYDPDFDIGGAHPSRLAPNDQIAQAPHSAATAVGPAAIADLDETYADFTQGFRSDAAQAATAALYASKPVASTGQLANYLISSFWNYNGTIAHHWGVSTISYNVDALTTAEKALALSALNAWQEVANLRFVQTSGSANIRFTHNGSMQAYETDTYTTSGVLTSAQVNISQDWITTDGGYNDGKTGIDSYGYQTYVHEIGHALGLGHQGPYNGSAYYPYDALYANDTWQYSIMSYFSQDWYDGSFRYVVTPQMADIYAVVLMYGGAVTRSTDTVYGFHSTAGSIYDFANYLTAPALTIYDSGGSDTLDCSGYSASQLIDLRSGFFSSIGGYTHNIGISNFSIVECAIGGSGNDSLLTNALGGRLDGGAGSDAILGGGGNDVLLGGLGNDTIVGGGGSDTIVGGSDNDVLYGQAGADAIDGSFGADRIFGGTEKDVVFGGFGNDVISGEAGDDFIWGEGNIAGATGDDSINGGDGNDTILGQNGNDTIVGGNGNDSISGGNGNDVCYGFAGKDIIFGDAGDDRICGGPGADILRGGTGADMFIFQFGDRGDLILSLNEGGVRDTFDLRGVFDAYGYTGTTPRADGYLQVVQNGADTDVYVHGTFEFRLDHVAASTITDSYFLFQ
ncbi:MAG: M10 family metallopeptidase [Xanthobacteraceae bacterium]